MITKSQMIILVRAMQIRKRRGEDVKSVLEGYLNLSEEERDAILKAVEK